ncbi:diguanylate cyclase [Gammaproteobacteria bacterium]
MNTPVSVILVEDSESDAALIIRFLRKAEFDVIHKRVETAEQMRTALHERAWDIVLCDYQLPGFRADMALAVLQESAMDIPFIIVSGAIGEELAVALMKAGAHDYVMKNNLARLAPAVQREIKEACERKERRHADEALRASEERWSFALEGAGDGVWDWNLNTGQIIFSRRWKEMLGFAENEIGGTLSEWEQRIHPEDLPNVQAALAAHITGKTATYALENRLLCKSGGWKWILSRGMAVNRDASGKPKRMIGTNTDISNIKQLEHALLRKTAMYAVLSGTNSAIVRIQDRQLLCDEICRISLKFSSLRLAWIGMVDEIEPRIVPLAVAGQASDYIRALIIHCTDNDPASIALREQRSIIANRPGIGLCLVIPLQGGGQHGVFSVCTSDVDYFDLGMVELLEEMSKDIAFALDKLHAAEEQRRTEARLRFHAQVFDKSAEAMIITAADNTIMTINAAFTEMIGYTLDEVRGQNPRMLSSGRHDRDFYTQMWNMLLHSGFWQGEIWNRKKNGEVAPQWLTINRVRDDNGEVLHYFALYADLTQQRASEELHYLKYHDALTGLANRLLLEDRVAEAIAQARQSCRYVGLLFANLDNFHSVNDLLGHVAGDKILNTTAARLCSVVGERGIVARFSGDTFVVALPNLNHPSEINGMAEEILEAIVVPFTVAEQNIQLTGRIGIAVYPGDGPDFYTLMKCADTAMLNARGEGRNSYRYFTVDLNIRTQRQFSVSTELRRALENNSFVLYYQPQIDIEKRKIIGAEALIRINHPERGIISPAEFIGVAEETGLIVPIGEWVIREACQQLQRWRAEGDCDLVIAVNVSPLQLRQPNLIDVIQRILDECGVEPYSLELEFTESAIMKNVDATQDLINRFREMGLHLAIDDFGTGYSSLSYLKQFQVNRLKIDQSFVRNLTKNANDAAIVKAIIGLAHGLNLKTIAEGVETKEQLNYLRTMHCYEMQGYLFSPPVTAEAFKVLYQSHGWLPV